MADNALLEKYMRHVRDWAPGVWLPSDDDPRFTRGDIDALDAVGDRVLSTPPGAP